MQISITTVTRCGGQNHYHLAGTIGGQSRTMRINRDDLALDPEKIEEAFLQRVRSHMKENSITTFTAAKAALEGITFQI